MIAETAGEWKAWRKPLMVSNVKMCQRETTPNQNREISTTVAKACKKSAVKIRILRFHRSTNTPAKGARTTMGANPKKEARDKYKALPVSNVIHQIMTNCAMDEPSNEANCPIQKNT
jgi:hypothetical protein